ncbi:MAG: O-antigen ligase family protein [Gaiellaceae bacterium]
MPIRGSNQPRGGEGSEQAGKLVRPSGLRRLFPGGLADLALALPMLVMLALLLFWAGDQGGFPPTVWYPGALIVLWLLVVLSADLRYSLGKREWRTGALLFFALFTVWCFLSITWATVKGDAWDGANQTLLYLTVYAIFSRWSTNVRIAGLFVALYAVAVAAIGFFTIENALHGGNVGSIFMSWRLASPIGYQNGEAALFLIPLWPALYLASRREVPPLARGLLAASGSLLVQMAVLAQSRGSMYAFPIVFLIFVALVSDRGRALVTALVVLAASLPNLGRLLDVFRAGEHDSGVAAALAQARNGMIVTFVLLLGLGTLAAILDRRLSLAEKTARRLDLAVVSGFLLALVLTVAVVVGSINKPVHRAQNAWHNFSTGAAGGSGSSHFTSLYGTHRYDFWRVSMDEFRAHPVAGVGTNNFATEYIQARRSDEEPNDPHSIEMRVLTQTGTIGALLFVGFLVSGLAATRRRDLDPFRRGLSASLVVGFSYWLVHGSVEWFWEIPTLTTAALAFLGLAAAVAAGGRSADAPTGPRAGRKMLIVLLALTALVASVSYLAPWLSAGYVDSASRSWRSHPAQAYQMLDRARTLDPLSDTPDVIAGTIAGRRHDYLRMKDAYTRALERDPLDWYAQLELGIAEYLTGNRSASLVHLERAKALNPRESLIRLVLRRVRAREKIDTAALDRAFLERALGFALGST